VNHLLSAGTTYHGPRRCWWPHGLLVRDHVFLPRSRSLTSLSENFHRLSGCAAASGTAAAARLRDVEEDLADDGAVARQVALDGADVLEAVAPDVSASRRRRQLPLLEHLRVHA
jgi:hypothetical protein